MGCRANYILVQDGTIKIYYARWGALGLPYYLLLGPEYHIANLSTEEKPVTSLLDNVWAEGGLLLDVDRRKVLFWGGEGMTPSLRRILLPSLHCLWAEWEIQWATQGQAEFARYLGHDISTVLAPESGQPTQISTAELPQVLAPDGTYHTCITVRWDDNHIADYLFPSSYSHTASTILSIGPSLLEFLHKRETQTIPHEQTDLGDGAYIDTIAKNIWLWEECDLDPRSLQTVEAYWHNWQVQGHVDGIVKQVQLSGRDPSGIALPKEEAINELIELILYYGVFRIFKSYTQNKATSVQQKITFSGLLANGQGHSEKEFCQHLKEFFSRNSPKYL